MSSRGERALATAAAVIGLVGAAYRWNDLARWGFWNDEAWVAISTRVEGPSQFVLSLAVTPLLWGALLRPLALLPHPELSLRLLPFAWSVLTLWLAWRLGTRLAGHALGGLLATALLAFDPASIQWAKQLKQYSAEAALVLAALLAADTVLRDGRGLGWLVVVLAVGATVSNAQLLVAPPLLATVLVVLVVRGDAGLARRVALATALVGTWDVAWYAIVIRPWMTPALREYYAAGGYLAWGDAGVMATAARAAFDRLLVPGLGPDGVWIAAGGAAVLAGTARTRPIAVVVTLLVLEVVVLAALRVVPIGIVRTSLFLITALLALTGVAAARMTLAPWSRPLLRPVAVIGLVVLAVAVCRDRPWRFMADVWRPEDVGPLIRALEAARTPDDRVLLYRRTAFVWAYYQTKTPVLDPSDAVTVGFLPRLDDPSVILIDATNAPQAIDRALAGARRVWFVGSRFAGNDETRIGAALAARAVVNRSDRRERALLLRATPR